MKRHFLKRLICSGQSMLEYSAIAVIVIVGILAMGPYVVRSVNAFFKGAEDQMSDSFREKIVQADLTPTEGNLPTGVDCDCGFLGAFALCGDGDYCPQNQLMDGRKTCDEFCFAQVLTGDAGARRYQCNDEPVPAMSWEACRVAEGDYPDGESGFDTWVDNGCGYQCCFEKEVVFPPECGTGLMTGKLKKLKRCGPDLVKQYFWEDDPACGGDCDPKDARATWCGGDAYNYNMTDPTVTYVEHGGCAEEAAECTNQLCRYEAWTCMAECPENMILDDGICDCEDGWVWDAGTEQCVCPPPYYQVVDGVCVPACMWMGCAGTEPCSYFYCDAPHDEPLITYCTSITSWPEVGSACFRDRPDIDCQTSSMCCAGPGGCGQLIHNVVYCWCPGDPMLPF